MPIRRLLLVLAAFLPFGKRFVYRRFFSARIGKGVRIGFGAILLFDKMELGDGVAIGRATIIDAQEIAIGPRSRIGVMVAIGVHTLRFGPSCTVSSRVTIRGDKRDTHSRLTTGAECWIFDFCFLDVTRPISMGRNVGVGGGSYIFTHGYWLPQLHGYPVSYGEVAIEDDVWLPWDCFIMPGVRIGRGCVVGARSLITKDVPPGALVAGSPAKVIRESVAKPVTSAERADMLIASFTDFAAARGERAHASRGESGWAILTLDGHHQVAIATGDDSPRPGATPPGILKVVHRPLSELALEFGESYFSTETFQGPPRAALNPVQEAWLQSLRLLGTRYYPVDEVDVESHLR